MIKPFIYAACEHRYYSQYAAAFLNSARAQGHEAEVFCDQIKTDDSPYVRTLYSLWRYRMLPDILKTHPAVLVLDVDSIIRKPIEIEPEYDLGLFPRTYKPTRPVLGGIFYCTDRAMEFAQALSDGMSAEDLHWGADQRVLWETYQAMGDKYRVKQFDHATFAWERASDPCIWTAKGMVKRSPEFLAEVESWSRKAA